MKRLVEFHFVLTFILLLAIGLFAGVALASTYTEGDNGKTITVNSGDTFTVKLDENPTTGYSWNMTVGNGLQIVSDRYIPPAQQIPGRGGYHEWTIKATRNGANKVSGIYKRPWEPATGDEQRFTLMVNAVAGHGKVPAFMAPSAFKLKLDVPAFPSFGGIFGHFPKLLK